MLLQVQQYCFVGSAGAYVANAVEPMHVEGDKRKASAGHTKVEAYLESIGAPFTVFHPLYMYGEHTAKDCEQWFIDRIIRDRPVPIPGPGTPHVCMLLGISTYVAGGLTTVEHGEATQICALLVHMVCNVAHCTPCAIKVCNSLWTKRERRLCRQR